MSQRRRWRSYEVYAEGPSVKFGPWANLEPAMNLSVIPQLEEGRRPDEDPWQQLDVIERRNDSGVWEKWCEVTSWGDGRVTVCKNPKYWIE